MDNQTSNLEYDNFGALKHQPAQVVTPKIAKTKKNQTSEKPCNHELTQQTKNLICCCDCY